MTGRGDEQPRPDRGGGQIVQDSVVFGDLVLIRDVTGGVVIGSGRRAYRVEQLPASVPELTAAHARDRPARLLQPRYAVVPFIGRDAEQISLHAWLDDATDPISVRLLHAAGGQGKTRLADHVAAAYWRAGWAVWQARHRPEAPAGLPDGVDSVVSPDQVRLPPAGGVLTVVDYADRWPSDDLMTLIRTLQQVAGRCGVRVRVLLLGRTAKGWWPSIVGRLDAAYNLDATSNRQLPPLTGRPADRDALFRTAAARFAERLGVPDVDPGWLTLPADLHRPEYTQILAVHMAALAAIDAYRRGERAPVNLVAVSDYLLCREYAAWDELHAHRKAFTRAPVMNRLAYVATLCGALPRPHARAALRRTELADTSAAADHLIDDHLACYPSTDPRTVFEPLHPDRLGEDLIALTTPGHPYEHLNWQVDDWTTAVTTVDSENTPMISAAEALTTDRVPGSAAAAWMPVVLAVLAETAHRWPHVATGIINPLLLANPHLLLTTGGATATRLTDLPNLALAVLEAVEPLLPDIRQINLDVAAAAVAERLTAHQLTTTTSPARRSRLHGALAIRLSHAGQHENALTHADAAVAICREAAAEDPAHRHDLATWLTNLCLQLSQAGRRQEALARAREAVGIRRTLAEVDADAHLPELAGALSNLGKSLAALGRHPEALEHAEEAATIYRRLAEADPEVYLPDLALASHNVAASQSDVGRRHEALLTAEESVALYRRLAEVNPDAYLSDLADALHNLPAYLSDIGRELEAVPAAEEAVRLYRRLADTNAAAFLPELAGSLYNLAVSQARAGLRHEALPPCEEAVAIYRELTDANPDAHQPDLALSLNNLGKSLSEVGRRQDAIQAAAEAVAIYRHLVAVDAEPFLPELAMALYNLAASLCEAERGPEAAAPGAEAVALYRQLVDTDTDAHLSDLANSLHNLAVILGELGRKQEALPLIEEAVALYRQLLEDDQDGFLAAWAMSLSTLGQLLSELGRHGEALPWAEQSVTLYRQLVRSGLEVHLPHLSSSLNNLAVCLSGLERHADARSAAEEAVSIYRRLAREYPALVTPHLRTAEQTLADIPNVIGVSPPLDRMQPPT